MSQVRVTVIPQRIHPSFIPFSTEYVKKRVAAYARVSTNDEEQLTSYEAQVDFYTNYIKANDEWEFAGLYADEGKSGTTTKRRNDFNRMISDALAGNIDLIITKSVSRFARNTVDTLTIVRQLKEKGVEVYFEKENIYTLDGKGELLITIMSSLAQEESRSMSENITWGQRKRMQDGKVSLPYKQFLGYKKGPDGFPAIVEEEAEIIRRIYRLFLHGKAPSTIASILMAEGIPSPAGKDVWRPNTVISILTNEKYKGDALLQKQFTVDFLTKKRKANEGEIPQYYVENSHPAIIDPEIFDLVQYELNLRKASGKWTSAAHPFSGKIICGDCGGVYGSKVWHSNSQYRRMVWQCNEKNKGADKCQTPHLTDDTIQAAFISAMNELISDRAVIRQAYTEMLHILTDNAALESERADLQNECDVVMEILRKHVDENARKALDQDEYQQRFNSYMERYSTARDRLHEIEALIIERTAKRANMARFMESLDAQADFITDFDEELWYTTVSTATVVSSHEMRFTFRDESEKTVRI